MDLVATFGRFFLSRAVFRMFGQASIDPFSCMNEHEERTVRGTETRGDGIALASQHVCCVCTYGLSSRSYRPGRPLGLACI
jgi:hypothetical protein